MVNVESSAWNYGQTYNILHPRNQSMLTAAFTYGPKNYKILKVHYKGNQLVLKQNACQVIKYSWQVDNKKPAGKEETNLTICEYYNKVTYDTQKGT